MLRIACDLDDCIFDFLGAYVNKFGEAALADQIITKNVYNLRNDKEFWENLPLLERPNFEPYLYCTKRINSKVFTKNALKKFDLPNKPVYQVYSQRKNKASVIKGRCDVLIDDSVRNVCDCLQAGLPALLIDRPHNQWFGPAFRIYHLDIDEITEAYNLLMQYA